MILNVKHPSALKTLTAAVLTLLLAGCGQTGPLYLPKKPAPPAATEQAAPKQAPAPTTK
jgi:predicted small lipoprotein YifL